MIRSIILLVTIFLYGLTVRAEEPTPAKKTIYAPYAGTTTGAYNTGGVRPGNQGHVPQTEDLKRYYKDQLSQAEQLWKSTFGPKAKPAAEGPAAGA